LQILAPVVLAGTLFVVAPAGVRAGDGMIETGTTTYEVIPSKNLIQVTIQISIYNTKPDTVDSSGIQYYYWNATQITVEKEAGPVTATSDAGSVSQSAVSNDNYYRYVQLNYPNVYYGQTRVVTATYSIPAAPHAAGGFRAGQAYASLCAVGNGWDTGTVSVVLPAGFELYVDDGGNVVKSDVSSGKQVYSSVPQANPYKFWTCIDAEDASNLTHTPLTAAGQAFDIESWPEDASWSSSIRTDVAGDVQRLEDLTGLHMPGGTLVIFEAGDQQLGEYGGLYNPKTKTASIPETVLPDTVAHELSHVWFNPSMFQDKWAMEGLAGYSEQAAGAGNYTPCTDPGNAPGSGPSDVMIWQTLTNTSTAKQQDFLRWQYAASCYLFTDLADSMGADNFRLVLEAAAAREMAYIGASPGEQRVGGDLPLSAKELLDLIDERGLIPSGSSDLDGAQNLLARYGIFDPGTLAARSSARVSYHSLAAAAKAWKLPDAIREPMSSWQFDEATAAMATAGQILGVRDAIEKKVPGISLDGTILQKQFEAAGSQADLANLLVLIKKESDAADKLDQATRLREGNHTFLQAIGLLGSDLATPLKQARTDLQAVKPDQAGAAAQLVIDRINASSDQGLLRAGGVVAALAVLMLLLALILLIRRRRPAVVVIGQGVVTGPVLLLPPGPIDDPSQNAWQTPPGPGPYWPPAGSWQPPSGSWQTQEAPPAPPMAPPVAQFTAAAAAPTPDPDPDPDPDPGEHQEPRES
jgi:hypothetical protein